MTRNSLLSIAKSLADESEDSVVLPVKNKIAYFVSHGKSYANNGYAVRTHNIASALNANGFNTLCMVRPGRPWELHEDIDCEVCQLEDGVEYLHFPWGESIPSNAIEHLEHSVDIFCEQLRLYRPEFVMAASNWIVALPAWIAAKKLGLPFFYEVRGFWELTREVKNPEYSESYDYKLEIELDTFLAQQAIRVFTLNTAMKNQLVERGVPFEKIDIVNNAVNKISPCVQTNEILRDRLGIAQTDRVVGYIGSVNDYEGLSLLIEACKSLSTTQPIKLVLVGDENPHSYSSDNPEQATQPDWLIRVGRIPHTEVEDYYSLIDVIAIPRLAYKVCELVPPMKAVEAITRGKRLVLSNLPALKDISGAKGQISYFTPNDVEQLKEALSKQLDEPELDVKYIHALKEHLFDTAIKSVVFALRQQRGSKPSTRTKLPFIVDYATASRWFYKQGNITDTLTVLKNLRLKGERFSKIEMDFEAFVSGLDRLRAKISLPPRQPNPGYLTKKSSVLYCLHQSLPYTTNGYATRSHGIAKGLSAAGWQVRCATRPGYPWDANIKEISKGLHEERIEGIVYSACAGWNLDKTPLDRYFAEATDFYLREAQTSGAELIIAASNHITAIPALTAARRLGIPFVYEMRGLWEVTQASSQPEWADSDRYYLMRKLEQDAALNADLVLTLTNELADEVSSWGVPRDTIEIIPNAVDEKTFKPVERSVVMKEKLNLPENVPVVGYAGSAVAYEGLDLLIKALSQLKENGQDFIFLLVGDGKVFDAIKEQAHNSGIDENCRFTGRVAFEEVGEYISCMDIMPIPRLSSPVTEMVSALKPLEAMAMGKAVILSDVSPHITMAGNNERALLFQKDSAASLANTIKRLILSPELRERLGSKARSWIESNRNWNKVSQNYSSALHHLLTENSKKTTSFKSKTLADLTIGIIADTFTTDTIASAVNTVALSPENWKSEIESEKVDVVFVESAWKGNDWQWHKKIGYYSDEEFSTIKALLHYCRATNIPTLFWNKEDPVHFERFKKVASQCDHVFTTDSRRIIPYLGIPNAITKTASSCPFYASPKIHNLLPSTKKWESTVAYGGTYYGARYPERTEYMDKIMSAAAPLGLTIYDRQHNDPDSPYKYPGGLGSYVAGSLTYDAMIQAYKAHPAQINVNSVLDSPTMFSRRVMEVAACGSMVISGPALGMNKYLENNAQIIENETQAAEALEAILQYPGYRWRKGLAGARAVMRAHTTEFRLTQMLRTAGMTVKAPNIPKCSVIVDTLTTKLAQQLIKQTILPSHIYYQEIIDEAEIYLQKNGISCEKLSEQKSKGQSVYLVIDNSGVELESHDIEDLLWPTFYAPQQRVQFDSERTSVGGNDEAISYCAAGQNSRLILIQNNTDNLLRNIVAETSSKEALVIRKPSIENETKPNCVIQKTLLIAGHDLKFIKPFYRLFQKEKIRILLDFWQSHTKHDAKVSRRLLEQADIVFCEWMLGNAIWYGKNTPSSKVLVGRLHAQELRSPLYESIPFEKFSSVIFVGPHMLRKAIERTPILASNGKLIYNGVDLEKFQQKAIDARRKKVLGLVGMVPQSKRLDRALDILKALRKDDQEFILRVKGKRAEDYPWMLNRPEEMEWFNQQYRRIETDPLLKDAVIFDPQGDDMPQWYQEIGFILSVSDHESFHMAIVEGAASGAIPIVRPWEGSKELYGNENISEDILEIKSKILSDKFAKFPDSKMKLFCLKNVFSGIKSILR
ncbi:glycosyltransferase [Salinimonas iocasae]|uniref:Glycosyltransferase n=1 Tax=Salinimonas iocasae TaxID=2572577 RepID=A0A5B7Y9F0_9ALTE|nr:glycosyltransferase [Salinimonas iocasae]QCZ92407.1 glycosyltransferase [Salinimonas iocasae]